MAGKAKAKGAKKRGRPTKFNAAEGERICMEILAGRTLREIEELPGFPTKSTILRWVAQLPDFCDQYAHAHDVRMRMYACEYARECVEIADGEDDAQKAQRRIDTRKWALSHLWPKVWGKQIEHKFKVNKEEPGKDLPPEDGVQERLIGLMAKVANDGAA